MWCCVALLAALIALLFATAWHLVLVDDQQESPWDFAAAHARKLYPRRCQQTPAAPIACSLPRILFMVGRNNGELSKPIADSWQGFEYRIVNTTLPSLRHSGPGPCSKASWATRLFEVYKDVFQETLDEFPEDNGFVFVEVSATPQGTQ